MNADTSLATVDMIRWTFAVRPEHRVAIEAYLTELGLDVFVHGDGQFHAAWDDPRRDMEEIISEMWEIHGEPFEVTQEEFHRVSLFLLQHDEANAHEAA